MTVLERGERNGGGDRHNGAEGKEGSEYRVLSSGLIEMYRGLQGSRIPRFFPEFPHPQQKSTLLKTLFWRTATIVGAVITHG